MKGTKALLRLIRFPNLLIIAGTQYMMRSFLIRPFLNMNGFSLQMDNLHFFILVLSTVLIAAGGYVINDYFDTQTDRVNKPERVVIDRLFSRQFAIKLHSLLTATGVFAGIYLSWHIRLLGLSVIFFLAAGLLWFYSTNYKRQLLIGNFIVSLLTGTVPLLVILFELPLLNRVYGTIMLQANSSFNYIFFWVSAFAFFAFLTNFIREIIKDTEDFEGDRAYGMNTLPISIGIFHTKSVIVSLSIVLGALLIWVLFRFIYFSVHPPDYISGLYFLIFLIMPIIFIILKIIFAKTKEDYHIASQLMKALMLFGLLYPGAVYYILTFHLKTV